MGWAKIEGDREISKEMTSGNEDIGHASIASIGTSVMLSLLTTALALSVPRVSMPPRMSGGAGTQVAFSKFQGRGNDFVLVDCRDMSEPPITPEQAAKMCDRNFGVGGDGVIFVLPSDDPEANCRMRIYNSDGSESEMCGNGIRCMAQYFAALEPEFAQGKMTISTLAGLIRPELISSMAGGVKVDMGPPFLQQAEIPTTLAADADGKVIRSTLEAGGQEWKVTCVSMGNPHAIVFVDDVAALDLASVGPPFETNGVFPAKTNTEFVQVLSPTHLKMKVWERGAGPTLACGTGACALTVAAVLEGLADRDCKVSLPGGDLQIEWQEGEGNGKIFMTGPALPVFSGSYDA